MVYKKLLKQQITILLGLVKVNTEILGTGILIELERGRGIEKAGSRIEIAAYEDFILFNVFTLTWIVHLNGNSLNLSLSYLVFWWFVLKILNA